MKIIIKLVLLCMMQSVLAGLPLNCPYKKDSLDEKVSYLYLDVYPNNLDPILSYEVEKNHIISQIYEPLYTMVYQEKPYRIGPHIASQMPLIHFLDAKFKPLSEYSPSVAYTVYHIPIRHGILPAGVRRV
jgi:ABC-type oligopeptide transport system substrate-binding subunit